MGLLDSVIGSLTGSNANNQQGSGTNPLIGILMSVLAAKVAGGSGGLGNILGNAAGGTGQGSGLGGMLGGAGAAGGLGSLVEQFTRNGHGDTVKSWIGHGENQPIEPHDLGVALGPETVDHLSQQTGIGGTDLLSQLSHLLPGAIDKLTPQDRLPNA